MTNDDFTYGYLEAAFFTETGTMEDGDLEHADMDDIAPESLAEVIRDCAQFQRDHAALLEQAYQREYDAVQAGRDYWFTRNGHGVGYWDRSELQADGLGDRLSDTCSYSEVWMYRGDDGKVYFQ